MTRVLVAPQEFKGTLTSREVSDGIAQVLREERTAWEIDLFPLADGGPGTLELLAAQWPDAERRRAIVDDPLGRPVEVEWLLHGSTAFIEMAQASGLWRMQALEPLDATTTGTGQLLRAAQEAGATRLVVGAGGSATSDGGAGALAALGARFLDSSGHPLPPTPRALVRCAAIARPTVSLQGEVWTDVRNPLLGPHGAAAIYGPQKGATAADVELIERALSTLASLAPGVEHLPGAGAAGGLAWGLCALAGFTVTPSFPPLASLTHLAHRVAHAQLIITGEGRLDEQTRFDKGPWALAGLAHEHAVPVVAVVGQNLLPTASWSGHFRDVLETGGRPTSPREALERLQATVRAWVKGTPLGPLVSELP